MRQLQSIFYKEDFHEVILNRTLVLADLVEKNEIHKYSFWEVLNTYIK